MTQVILIFGFCLTKKYENIWPDENKIKDFKTSYIKMGDILYNIQLLLLKHFDVYLEKIVSNNFKN